MRNVVWMGGKEVYDPEELRHLSVAFDNCRAAMPEAADPEFSERLARKLIGWSGLGRVDATQLYIRALHQYRALQAL